MVETFYLHLEFGSKKGWSINLPFLCTKCGKCCKLDDFLTAGKLNAEPKEYVEVQDKVKYLYEELGKMWEADEAKYDKYLTQKPCPFLVNNSCSIYEIRPDGCRLYPKTAFGMHDPNCAPLIRFKKMCVVLKKGKICSEKYYFTGKISCLAKSDEPIKPVHFTEKQYHVCIAKLRQEGITDEELAFFNYFNGI
jgi:Fe-S-cluster containining protein